jgi:hypothetical protein
MKTGEDASDTACDTSATDAFDFGFWYCDLLPLPEPKIYEGNNTNCAFLLVCKCHNKFCSYTHFRLNFDSAMKRFN